MTDASGKLRELPVGFRYKTGIRLCEHRPAFARPRPCPKCGEIARPLAAAWTTATGGYKPWGVVLYGCGNGHWRELEVFGFRKNRHGWEHWSLYGYPPTGKGATSWLRDVDGCAVKIERLWLSEEIVKLLAISYL